MWSRRYSGPGNGQSNDDVARSVAVSPDDGTVFVTGYRMADTQDFATIAYNVSTGATLWARYYNGPANSTDAAYSLAAATTGTVVVTGISYGATSGADYLTIAYTGGG